jgi:hypothetical protein
LSDTSTTPTDTSDAFPAFDEASTYADIVDYSHERAMGEPEAPRAMVSGPPRSFVLSALPPEYRGDIPQRLAAISDPAERARMEAKLVEPVYRQLAVAANIRRGHPNGTPYDQAVAEVTNQVWTLESEDQRLADQMSAIARYDTKVDPKTDQPTPVPVYVIEGAARERIQRRRIDIAQNITALEGPEGKARLKRAAEEELAKRAEAHENRRILFEAEKRAKEMVANERIEELARAKAKSLRGNL